MDKKNFIISVLTVCVQYYDYHLFGFLAAEIAAYFFPNGEIIVQLLNTYFLLALAMIAKPLSAIVLGKIGDTKGRSNSFKISLLGTAIASSVIFFIPSYESIGMMSTFLLLISRMSICAFVSAGSDGVRIYIYEHMSKKNQCLGIGITALFAQGGSLVASLSALFFTVNTLPSYSWKFAFLFGSALGIIVLLIMKITNFTDQIKISENVKFNEYKNVSFDKIITSNGRLFVICMLLAGAIGSSNQFIIIFFGTYNFKVLQTISSSEMRYYTSLAIGLYMIFAIFGGYLADRFGRYKTSQIGIFLSIFFSILQCTFLNRHELSPVLFLLNCASLPLLTIPAAAIFKESLPISIRYRIFSLSHALGSIFISAPTAFISTLLYYQTNIAWLPLCYFILTILMISLSLYILEKKFNQNETNKNIIK